MHKYTPPNLQLLICRQTNSSLTFVLKKNKQAKEQSIVLPVLKACPPFFLVCQCDQRSTRTGCFCFIFERKWLAAR